MLFCTHCFLLRLIRNTLLGRQADKRTIVDNDGLWHMKIAGCISAICRRRVQSFAFEKKEPVHFKHFRVFQRSEDALVPYQLLIERQHMIFQVSQPTLLLLIRLDCLPLKRTDSNEEAKSIELLKEVCISILSE